MGIPEPPSVERAMSIGTHALVFYKIPYKRAVENTAGTPVEVSANPYVKDPKSNYEIYPLIRKNGVEMIAEPSVMVYAADNPFYSVPDTIQWPSNPNEINGPNIIIELRKDMNINVYDHRKQLIVDNNFQLTSYAKNIYGLRQEDLNVEYKDRYLIESMDMDPNRYATFDEKTGIIIIGNNLGCTYVCLIKVLEATIDLGNGFKVKFERYLENPWCP